MKQHVWPSTVQVRSCQEVSTDHLQAVAAGFVAADIMAAVSIACSITGIWLLVDLEINELVRLTAMPHSVHTTGSRGPTLERSSRRLDLS